MFNEIGKTSNDLRHILLISCISKFIKHCYIRIYEHAYNMRRELMVFAKFSSNYARTIKAAIFWERDKCFLFWTVSTSCAHYSRHYENKLPVDMRLLPRLPLIPLSLHREGQKANGERWTRDGKRKSELKRARQNISAAIMHTAFIKRRFFF